MPTIEKHAPGSFCWVELGTTDQNSAKNFYSNLFGWLVFDMPNGGDGFYTMFTLNKNEAGAAYTMQAGERSMTPPHWNLYVAVEDADATTQRAAELGAQIISRPFDVTTFGRMAVLRDPTGAVFLLWQAKTHAGLGLRHEHGAFCWADLSTSDPERAKQFYSDLFGWTIGPLENYPPEYAVIQNDGTPMGGIPPAQYRDPSKPPNWMIYFQVDDVDALAEKAKELGGKELMPPTSAGPARVAVLTDGQGAPFSIIRPPAKD